MRAIQGFFLAALLLKAAVCSAASETVQPYAQLALSSDNLADSARLIAEGSAFTAAQGDISFLAWNPAGLAGLSSAQIALHHNFYLQDFTQDTLAFAAPLAGIGSWGLSVGYLGYGNLPGRDANGNSTGNLGAGRWNGEIAWADPLFSNLSVGLGLKANLLNLPGSSYSNLALDTGILWRMSRDWSWGAVLANMGTSLDSYLADASVRLGGIYVWHLSRSQKILLAANCSWEPYGVTRLHFGAEAPLGSFFLRGGYVARLDANDLDGLTGLTAGLGITFQDFVLDYAYSPDGNLGQSQRISLTYNLEGTSASRQPAAIHLPRPPPPPPPPPSTLGGMTSPSSFDARSPAPGVRGGGTTPQSVTVFSSSVTAAPPPSSASNNNGPKLQLLFSLPPAAVVSPPASNPVSTLADYQAAVSENPQDSNAWLKLGELYALSGQKTEALGCFEQIAQLRPQDVRFQNWLAAYKAHLAASPASSP